MTTNTLCCGYNLNCAIESRTRYFHEINSSHTINQQCFFPLICQIRKLDKKPPNRILLLHSQPYCFDNNSGLAVNVDIVLPNKQIMFWAVIVNQRCAEGLRQDCLEKLNHYIEFVNQDQGFLSPHIGKSKPYKSIRQAIQELQKEKQRQRLMKPNAFLKLRNGFFVPVEGNHLSDKDVKSAWKFFCSEFGFDKLASLPVDFMKQKEPTASQEIISLMADVAPRLAKRQSQKEIQDTIVSEILGILGLV